MPFVAADQALNRTEVCLETLCDAQGPPPWRQPLVASGALRVVLLGWPPGFCSVPHMHPRAAELFLILDGRAGFQIGGDAEVVAGPRGLLLAPPGTWHAIRVLGDAPLLMMVTLAPNEDAVDETIERPSE